MLMQKKDIHTLRTKMLHWNCKMNKILLFWLQALLLWTFVSYNWPKQWALDLVLRLRYYTFTTNIFACVVVVGVEALFDTMSGASHFGGLSNVQLHSLASILIEHIIIWYFNYDAKFIFRLLLKFVEFDSLISLYSCRIA